MSPGKRHTFHRPATILCQARFDRSNELRKAAIYRPQRNEPATAWHIAADDRTSAGKVLVQLQAVTVGREPVPPVGDKTNVACFYVEGNLLRGFRAQVVDIRPSDQRLKTFLTFQVLRRPHEQEGPVTTTGGYLSKETEIDSWLNDSHVADDGPRYRGHIIRDPLFAHRLLKETIVH